MEVGRGWGGGGDRHWRETRRRGSAGDSMGQAANMGCPSPKAWAGKPHALWEAGPGPLPFADSFGPHSSTSPGCYMFSVHLHTPQFVMLHLCGFLINV